MFSRRRRLSLSRPESFNQPQLDALGRARGPIYGADMPQEWYGRGERPAEDETDLSDDPNRPLPASSRAVLPGGQRTEGPAGRWEHRGAESPLGSAPHEEAGRHPAWRSGGARALLALGRIAFGGFFLYNGVRHFRNRESMKGYVASKHVPAPDAAIIGSGILLLIAGLSLTSGARPKIGAAAAATFLAGVSPMMHDFWNVSDPAQQAGEQAHFMKNMALLGASLLAAATPEPWPYALHA